jgi:hypothetical protein
LISINRRRHTGASKFNAALGVPAQGFCHRKTAR